MAKKQFKAESKRLLDLMINSIYTHKEIFLRELISNASDAIDKLAYLALTDQNVGLSRNDFAITLTTDEKMGILTVSDNGIGMSREEMEENLGTIAKSGSYQFKKTMEKTEEVDIIGQFGVGFYAAFMVAEAVSVISKKYGEEQAYLWQSAGADGYTVTPCEKDGCGTDVILKFKKDTEDEKYSRFLKDYELRALVRKYSDYIRYPIRMEVEKTREKEVPEGAEKPEKPEYETYREIETVNSMVPLWQRAKKDVKQEEYDSFYRDKFYDFEAPLSVIHTSVEGAVSYKALLFIPAKAPYDFYTKDFKKGLQLYASGVLIMENCEDLLPDHFRFVRGVVDSQDLSLNISREMLQHDRQLKLIAVNLEKKIRAELEKLRDNDAEKYEKFFDAFGAQLKYGVVADYGIHKESVQDLLMFRSANAEKRITLKQYVDAMPEEQKKIYFAAGEGLGRLAQLPQAEPVR
ncbi:MAG: molecular chaperone HtpG, partial [Oscillospiraceae bacterium]|nr:molecular chaperone HtpG [Oscillospiraceae bacterium]